MSFHDHEPDEFNKKFGVKKRIADEKAKNNAPTPIQLENLKQIINETEFTDERIGSYIKVYGMAKNMSLEDFINWCKGSDYYFEKPIKTPKP